MFQLRRVCYGSSEPSPVWSCSDDINFLSLLAILKMYVTRHEGPKFLFNMCVYIYIYIYICICVIPPISLIHTCGLSYCVKFLFLFTHNFSVND